MKYSAFGGRGDFVGGEVSAVPFVNLGYVGGFVFHFDFDFILFIYFALSTCHDFIVNAVLFVFGLCDCSNKCNTARKKNNNK